MRRRKVGALGRRATVRRRRRPRGRSAAATADVLVNLGIQFSAAGWRAKFLRSAYRAPVGLDERTYEEHARRIQEQFGVDIECPELTYLASRRARFEHAMALRRIAPGFATLLKKQAGERERFLQRHVPGMTTSYAEIAAFVTAAPPDGHQALWNPAIDFEGRRARHETEGKRLVARLQKVVPVKRSSKRGPAQDLVLVTAADGVAQWTKEHPRGTGKRDWVATACILTCHRWDLRTILGCTGLVDHAARLKDRVRKSWPAHWGLAAPRKGKVSERTH